MMKPQDAWLATQGQLQLQLHRATYDTWLRDCKYVGYQDGVFILSVKNGYIKDWLENKLYRAVHHTLCGIFQQQIEVKFVVSNPARERMLQPDYLPLGNDFGRQDLPPDQEDDYYDVPELAEPEWNPQLNRTYTFQTFIVGPSNQMAQAAAQAISNKPGQAYNPLFVYGDVGLGKTHLLHAIGNTCFDAGLKVLYTTSEQFMNDLVEAIRHKNTSEFRDYYRTVDVLLVDDVQFMAGKESTQEEFFHTFNALREQGKQVVLASDRSTQEMKKLDSRLQSRFEWGLSVDIQPPSFETRLAILNDKSEIKGQHLPGDVAELIATRCEGSIRNLEGVLTQLLAHTTLLGMPLNVEFAEQILRKSAPGSAPRLDVQAIKRKITLEDIFKATATHYQLSLNDVLSKKRTKDIAHVRQLAIYLAREETEASWPEIGEALGGRNHSTVLHSYKKVAESIETNPALIKEMDAIRQRIYAG